MFSFYSTQSFSTDLTFVAAQIEDHSIVSFLPLDITNEDSLTAVLSHIDHTMQFGEDEEPKAPEDLDGGEISLDVCCQTHADPESHPFANTKGDFDPDM